LVEQGHDPARPQPHAEPVLPRVVAVDPAEHLLLLGRCELRRTARDGLRQQRALALIGRGFGLQPAVDRRAVHAQRLHHHRRLLAFSHPPHGKQSKFLQRRVIEGAGVSLHASQAITDAAQGKNNVALLIAF